MNSDNKEVFRPIEEIGGGYAITSRKRVWAYPGRRIREGRFMKLSRDKKTVRIHVDGFMEDFSVHEMYERYFPNAEVLNMRRKRRNTKIVKNMIQDKVSYVSFLAEFHIKKLLKHLGKITNVVEFSTEEKEYLQKICKQKENEIE